MPTKYYEFNGRVKWAKLNENNKDTTYDEFGTYSLNLYPATDKDWETYKDSGIRTNLDENKKDKEDEDGKFVTFRRKHKQLFSGELQTLGPPKVTYQGNPFNGLVPNGSVCRVRVAAFTSRKGIGHRLLEVHISELAEMPLLEESARPF